MNIDRRGPAPADACPRCLEPLALSRHSEVRVCHKCGGAFASLAASRAIVERLDRSLLEIGFQASLGKPTRKDDRRTLTCPECLGSMHKCRIESATCEVDACPDHGTWFDAGELETVMRAFANARRRGVFHRAGPEPGPTITPSDPPLDGTSSSTEEVETEEVGVMAVMEEEETYGVLDLVGDLFELAISD